jgi:hypothetical protein
MKLREEISARIDAIPRDLLCSAKSEAITKA